MKYRISLSVLCAAVLCACSEPQKPTQQQAVAVQPDCQNPKSKEDRDYCAHQSFAAPGTSPLPTDQKGWSFR